MLALYKSIKYKEIQDRTRKILVSFFQIHTMSTNTSQQFILEYSLISIKWTITCTGFYFTFSIITDYDNSLKL